MRRAVPTSWIACGLAALLCSLPVAAREAAPTALAAALTPAGYTAVPMTRHGDAHLTVDVRVNDVAGTFILDTGAGRTVIDRAAQSRFDGGRDVVVGGQATGAGGSGMAISALPGNRLRIGDYRDDAFTVHFLALDHVNAAFSQRGETPVDGVIGADILERGGAVIDYPNLRLYLRNPAAADAAAPLTIEQRTTMKAYDVKKGNVVEHNGTVYQVRDIERSAPQGRGGGLKMRFTLYSVPGGNKFDLNIGGDDDLKEVELQRRQATFSYKDGEAFVFMDDEDYTPYTLDADVVGDASGYITDALSGCYVQIIDEQPVGLQLPPNVVLEVIETPPELKGGTATKRPKPARLNTGIEIQVPEYISNGERILVSTSTGEFGGRAD